MWFIESDLKEKLLGAYYLQKTILTGMTFHKSMSGTICLIRGSLILWVVESKTLKQGSYIDLLSVKGNRSVSAMRLIKLPSEKNLEVNWLIKFMAFVFWIQRKILFRTLCKGRQIWLNMSSEDLVGWVPWKGYSKWRIQFI